ncbi:hypothetical protein C8F01DRAFT_1090255 [Mycena amicta]|nr:hypothetical protein C8F01DRAFT_1090255 [Mycena amicta]
MICPHDHGAVDAPATIPIVVGPTSVYGLCHIGIKSASSSTSRCLSDPAKIAFVLQLALPTAGKMLAKLTQTAILAASLIHLAAATRTIPVVPPTSLQCCTSVVESSSPQIQSLFTLLDVDLGGAVVPVGLDFADAGITIRHPIMMIRHRRSSFRLERFSQVVLRGCVHDGEKPGMMPSQTAYPALRPWLAHQVVAKESG